MINPSRPGDLMNKTQPLKMRWVMISFAMIATTLNYVHRLSFNYLASNGYLRDIIPDDTFGYIATSFFIAYLISNGISGFIIDKLGTRLGYSLCMAFWTTAGILHALAMSPFQFGLLRFLLGIGEAGNWPAAIKLTTEWFPPEERSTASGIFNSGAAAGAVIAPILISWLGSTFGWQTTFVVIGVLGYLWLALFWFSYYTPEKTIKESKARIVPPLKLLKNKFVLSLTLSKGVYRPGVVLHNVLDWKISGRHVWMESGNHRLVCHVSLYSGRSGKYTGRVVYAIDYQKRRSHSQSQKNRYGLVRVNYGFFITTGSIPYCRTVLSLDSFSVSGFRLCLLRRQYAGVPGRCCTLKCNGIGMGHWQCWVGTGRSYLPIAVGPRSNEPFREV